MSPSEHLLQTAAGLLAADDVVGCVALCEQIVSNDPSCHNALHLLGISLVRRGRASVALDPLERAIAMAPSIATYHNTLGVVLAVAGREHDAAAAFTRAVQLDVGFGQAHLNLATALQGLGLIEHGCSAANVALRLMPGNPTAMNVCGKLLAARGDLKKAARLHRQAVQAGGGVESLKGLAEDFEKIGCVRGAVRYNRLAVAFAPADGALHSGLLYLLQHDAKISPAHLRAEHECWASRHAHGFMQRVEPHGNACQPGRRLNIGYLSADFREHSIARFLEPLLAHHDRSQFKLCCYSDVQKFDDATRRFQGYAGLWRNTRGHSDVVVYQQIRRDRVDILIDPTGHMGANRMLVFARRAAPIQVAFPGYPYTCGLNTMGGFITDSLQNPLGYESKLAFAEKIIRLESSPRCYRISGDEPPVTTLPAHPNGHITFGSFNRLLKITSPTIALWASLLQANPGSRLVMRAGAGAKSDAAQRYRRMFARRGIAQARLVFINDKPRREFLADIGKVDIALDSFPYTGCTTTCDALYMGVPVISLVGESYVSRVGLSILSQVGLGALAVRTPAEYLRVATDLASDLPRLRCWRETLRKTMSASSLCDGLAVTREFENQLRELWVEWCVGTSNEADAVGLL